MSFRIELINHLVETLIQDSKVLALWQAGSAANNSTDEYSDIDLLILADGFSEKLFEEVEDILNKKFRIIHRYVEEKPWQEGQYQRIYFFEGAPKHFFLDLGILSKNAKNSLNELMQKERHGSPVIYFDKLGLIKAKPLEKETLLIKQKKRIEEIEAFFPVYFKTVMKEIERGHAIDAFSFYFGGLLKPLVELLGLLYRPERFDFGFRYLHKDFPKELQDTIQSLLYVNDVNSLKGNALKTEKLFRETITKLKLE